NGVDREAETHVIACSGRHAQCRPCRTNNREQTVLERVRMADEFEAPGLPGPIRGLGESLAALCILTRHEGHMPYVCAGLALYRELPPVVVLPETEAHVIAVMQACCAFSVPIVARGAGTGLSGGATPHRQGVLLGLAKLNRIKSIDPDAATAVVEPGVRNLAISEAVAPYGMYYAPDPSSQIACSIGGNVA